MTFKLSNQAIGALMMAVQKGIMDECDITELLKEFKLFDSADGLVVENPPVLHFEENDGEEVSA